MSSTRKYIQQSGSVTHQILYVKLNKAFIIIRKKQVLSITTWLPKQPILGGNFGNNYPGILGTHPTATNIEKHVKLTQGLQR